MEHLCKNCTNFEPQLMMSAGNCKAKTKKAKENKTVPLDKIHKLENPKQGDIMAEAWGISVGSEYGSDCTFFEAK